MRKVRTPEGSRYYGLPIGSPITADAIARAKMRNGGAPAPKAEKAASSGGGNKNRASAPSAPAAKGPANDGGASEVVKVRGFDVVVPKGSRQIPSPTNSDKTYIVAPDETIITVSAKGGPRAMDDATADRLLDLLVAEGHWEASDASAGEDQSEKRPSAGEYQDASPSTPTRDPASMGRSIAERTKADIEEFRHSKITGKHITADGKFTPEREALHDEIIERFLEGLPVKDKPTQYMNGGGPAAGKSSMTRGENAGVLNYPAARVANELTGEFDPMDGAPEALLLDSDSIKMQLPEVQEALARFRDGSPLPEDSAWAGDSHAESSYLAERLHRAALERGHDIIFDGTGNGSVDTMKGRIQTAKDLGYRVEANYLFAEPTVGIERATARARRSSRAVPEPVIRSIYAKIPPIFEALREEGIFDKVRLFDNNGEAGAPARLIAEGDGPDFKIHDPQAYVNFLSSSQRTDDSRFTTAAREKMSALQSAEPTVTAALRDSLGPDGVIRAVRVSSPDQVDAEIRVSAAERGMTPEMAATEMAEALTYSVEIDEARYAQIVEKALADFRSQNIRIEAMLNRFASGGAGVAITARTPDGTRFQAEFHTPESAQVADRASDLYAQMRTVTVGSSEYEFLSAGLQEITKGLSSPSTLPTLKSE